MPRLWQPVSLGPAVVVVEARGGELGAVDAALADANLGRDHIIPNFLIEQKLFFFKKTLLYLFRCPHGQLPRLGEEGLAGVVLIRNRPERGKKSKHIVHYIGQESILYLPTRIRHKKRKRLLPHQNIPSLSAASMPSRTRSISGASSSSR